MTDTGSSKRLIGGIMAAVGVWGGLLAVGAWWRFGNHDPWRAVIVAGCVAAFLGFWGGMLALRARRLRGR
jgi:ABC-type branched-subunit amino acid transport system permease subunit